MTARLALIGAALLLATSCNFNESRWVLWRGRPQRAALSRCAQRRVSAVRRARRTVGCMRLLSCSLPDEFEQEAWVRVQERCPYLYIVFTEHRAAPLLKGTPSEERAVIFVANV